MQASLIYAAFLIRESYSGPKTERYEHVTIYILGYYGPNKMCMIANAIMYD